MGDREKMRHIEPLSLRLPALKNTESLYPAQISSALRHLLDIFCFDLTPVPALRYGDGVEDCKLVLDSGYVSEEDGGDEVASFTHGAPRNLDVVRLAKNCAETSATISPSSDAADVDPLEKEFAIRWLTNFVCRVHEINLDEESCENFSDVACSILEHLTSPQRGVGLEDCDDDEDPGIMRTFDFLIGAKRDETLSVQLHDVPMQLGKDHTDVGLQTWGASIAFSEMLCDAPERFGLTRDAIRDDTRIVELGAGTGLLSLVLAKLMPHVTRLRPTIVATDYHPTVLANLEVNIAAQMENSPNGASLKACHLDWSSPPADSPVLKSADFLFAADVAYASQHAAWLRDCAAELLSPDGLFWLMVSIRPNGKFSGIRDTVEEAFAQRVIEKDGKRFTILSKEVLEKREGVGRADESGYKLFQIGWE